MAETRLLSDILDSDLSGGQMVATDVESVLDATLITAANTGWTYFPNKVTLAAQEVAVYDGTITRQGTHGILRFQCDFTEPDTIELEFSGVLPAGSEIVSFSVTPTGASQDPYTDVSAYKVDGEPTQLAFNRANTLNGQTTFQCEVVANGFDEVFLVDPTLVDPAGNFVRSGNVFSTADAAQTFTFETPFDTSDGTTDSDITVVITRQVATASLPLSASNITVNGFVVDRDNAIDGVGTTEPFGYIAVNKNALAKTVVRPEDATLTQDDTSTDPNEVLSAAATQTAIANASGPTVPADSYTQNVDVTALLGAGPNGESKFKRSFAGTHGGTTSTGNLIIGSLGISFIPSVAKLLRIDGFVTVGTQQRPAQAFLNSGQFNSTQMDPNGDVRMIWDTAGSPVSDYDITVYWMA